MTSAERRPVKRLIRDPQRSQAALNVKEITLQLHNVTAGLLPLPPAPEHPNETMYNHIHAASCSADPSHVSEPVFSHHQREDLVLGSSSDASTEATTNRDSVQDLMKEISKRRAQEATSSEPPKKKAKRPKQCRKCALGDTCNGRQNINLCKNPCKDCGKVRCLGRNTNRPNTPCHRAWD